MPVFKRQYESGTTVWRYIFSAPGATRQERRLICEVGFASKQEAVDAEAKRRTVRRQLFLRIDDNYFSLSTTITF